MRTRRIRRRTRNHKFRNVKKNRTRGLVKRGGGKSVRNRKWIKRRQAVKRGGVPPNQFPREINVTKIDGTIVTLGTQSTNVGNITGATGAGTVYTDSYNKYYVKVMTADETQHQPPSHIKRIFSIEVEILKHLNTTYNDSKYFPKYLGSMEPQLQNAEPLWAIATEILPNANYADLLTNYVYAKTKFANVAKQLCEGLSLLHTAGVYHRDIKLENVVIDTNTGQIMYIDFNGCYNEELYTKLEDIFTADNKPIDKLGHDGTPTYRHPEIVSIAQSTNFTEFGKIENLPKYDYWALAQLLYSLNYDNTSAFETLYSIPQNQGEEMRMLTYFADMESIKNYTINPNIHNGKFKATYKTVYNNIQKLDTQLRTYGCWTFTDLMNASDVKTSITLTWPHTPVVAPAKPTIIGSLRNSFAAVRNKILGNPNKPEN